MLGPAIVQCSSCRQSLRLQAVLGKTYRISCPNCKATFLYKHFTHNPGRSSSAKSNPKYKTLAFVTCIILLAIDVAYPFVAIPLLRNYGDSGFQSQINEVKEEHKAKLARVNEEKTEILEKTTPEARRVEAESNYARELSERLHYNSRYALSVREKAQLKMYSLSKDKTLPVEQILRELAGLAAPNNATIRVNYLKDKFQLDIDFDMSELSPGEKGSKTTHRSLDSLKREVQRLTYKVTNDVYTFSKELGLESMSIGCRHYVNMHDNGYGSKSEENVVVYKIRLNRASLAKLENNPFLDIYSTAQYMEILTDDFPNLQLVSL